MNDHPLVEAASSGIVVMLVAFGTVLRALSPALCKAWRNKGFSER